MQLALLCIRIHDTYSLRKIDAEGGRVVLQRETLAGVEEHAVAACVDPPSQAVLTEDARTARRVFHQDSDRDHDLKF